MLCVPFWTIGLHIIMYVCMYVHMYMLVKNVVYSLSICVCAAYVSIEYIRTYIIYIYVRIPMYVCNFRN